MFRLSNLINPTKNFIGCYKRLSVIQDCILLYKQNRRNWRELMEDIQTYTHKKIAYNTINFNWFKKSVWFLFFSSRSFIISPIVLKSSFSYLFIHIFFSSSTFYDCSCCSCCHSSSSFPSFHSHSFRRVILIRFKFDTKEKRKTSLCTLSVSKMIWYRLARDESMSVDVRFRRNDYNKSRRKKIAHKMTEMKFAVRFSSWMIKVIRHTMFFFHRQRKLRTNS